MLCIRLPGRMDYVQTLSVVCSCSSPHPLLTIACGPWAEGPMRMLLAPSSPHFLLLAAAASVVGAMAAQERNGIPGALTPNKVEGGQGHQDHPLGTRPSDWCLHINREQCLHRHVS